MRYPDLGPYRIEGRLAAGGMAEVFVAHRTGPHGFQKRVALKKILPQHVRDPEFVGMFIDEARLAAMVEHPNIVQVFDFGEYDHSLIIAMEMVDGTTVGKLLRTVSSHGRTVPLGPALHIAQEASQALTYAHELRDEVGEPLGIVHRDVSPANLLLNRQGHVKLTDFGIARCHTTIARTEDGHIRGKLGYMSPEQVVGQQVGPTSDVFTLSVVLAELLIAEPLFSTGGDLDVLLQIKNVDLTNLRRAGTHLPKDVMRLLEWGMTTDPEMRPSSRSFERALREVMIRRGELGTGARELARLLEMLQLVPGSNRDQAAQEAGARPTFLVELSSDMEATAETKKLLDELASNPPQTYELLDSEGAIEGPIPFSEMVRRIVTGELPEGAMVRCDEGDFESAGRVPELRRYIDSKALNFGEHGPPSGATRRGVLHGGRLLSQVYQLTTRRETGVLHLWEGPRRKKIYYLDGRPDFVASNIETELFGEYLVGRGSIVRMELEMALAMLPRYDGRLGDALVGLGMLRPVQLYQAVSEQVKARYLDAFRWSQGQWAYVPGEVCGEETFPISQGEHEFLRDAAMQPSVGEMTRALRPAASKIIASSGSLSASLAPYRLSRQWEDVIARGDGTHTLSEILGDAGVPGDQSHEQAQRALYLGLSCHLLQVA